MQTIRGYHASHGSTVLGWLCAMNHPQLGASLRAMHRAPAERWSVDSLAAVAGMSRSAFAERFKERVGDAPAFARAFERVHGRTPGAFRRDVRRPLPIADGALSFRSR